MSDKQWSVSTLGSILRLEYGAALPATSRSGEGFPVFGSSGEVGRHDQAYVPRAGIIIGRKGTVGAVAWSVEPFWPIDTTYYVEPMQELDARWCYWLLVSLPLNRLDSSTGVPGLNRRDAYSVEVPLPSVSEQRRIAEILDAADEAIQQTDALIAKLKQVKQGLLHDLLTRGLDENGELRDPVAHPEQFKNSPLGRIPRGWEVRQLDEVADIGSGVTLGRANIRMGTVELPYLRVANVQDGFLDLNDVKTVVVRRDEIDRFALVPGDVLMNEGGDFDKLGRGTVWEGQISLCLHQNHVFRVRPIRDLLNPYYLSTYSASSAGKRYFVLSSKQSTNLASINSTQLKAFPVPIPPIAEQEDIAGAIAIHDARIRAEESYRDKLQLLKQGLMQDLLTGRVRVPAPEAEPELVAASA